jgi:hypothetical protein
MTRKWNKASRHWTTILIVFVTSPRGILLNPLTQYLISLSLDVDLICRHVLIRRSNFQSWGGGAPGQSWQTHQMGYASLLA